LQKNPENLVGLLGIHVLLEHDAELLAQRLELSQVLLVLALVLDLGLDACLGGQSVSVRTCGSSSGGYVPHWGVVVPSKTRTAVGKSLTLRAARRAADRTAGEGTRS
jgi:hypothetical protein